MKDRELGLSTEQARLLLNKYGRNELIPAKKEFFLQKILHIVCQPMFLLLIFASVTYFILGEPQDGAVMLIFVAGIISIEVIQRWKTDKTLDALKDLSAPHITVLRDGIEQIICSSELVPGDIMYVSEGIKIPADGEILRASTLCIDESSLTGESKGRWKVAVGKKDFDKEDYWRQDFCYAGTLVIQGFGTVLVKKTGAGTEYGKIGKDIAAASEALTPLEKQTGKLVKYSAAIAAGLFVLVAITTYINISDHLPKDRIIESILAGITIAMAMIPEEFPVIMTVFLSMGAWRLAKENSLVRRLPAVETLGEVSVLCVDKTGTITMNQMTVSDTWAFNCSNDLLTEVMGLACETDAYDPMEKAMLNYCENNRISREHLFSGKLVFEYAFTDELKMMGHVWKHDGELIIAVKGSSEQVIKLCNLTTEENLQADKKIIEFSQEGQRVIAVAMAKFDNIDDMPEKLTDCSLSFCGLIGLTDPPRESIREDIRRCTKAGIRVVMITGDNGITARAIAKKINMPNSDNIITGNELDMMSDTDLRTRIKEVSIFSRVIPQHKMRIVKAFQENGEVVAMTGDGVNDAPALKHADIGIAMGKRGSEVSREAADLILLDDNFSTIVNTIKDGRRIYDNIRKAIEYVFAIHIPIAAASLLAPLLGISPANLLLLPLHVVLLELIIDPTCSIVLERQPAEKNIMERAPRKPNEKILTARILGKSLVQGLAIFGAAFGTYLIFLNTYPACPQLARTMGIAIIFLSNLFLVYVNSSDYELAYKAFAEFSKDKIRWQTSLGTIIGLLLIIYTPLNDIFELAPLSVFQLVLALGIASAAVLWYEIVKIFKEVKTKGQHTQ